jgi:hypothetical protein
MLVAKFGWWNKKFGHRKNVDNSSSRGPELQVGHSREFIAFKLLILRLVAVCSFSKTLSDCLSRQACDNLRLQLDTKRPFLFLFGKICTNIESSNLDVSN